jgi:hypothetical protein
MIFQGQGDVTFTATVTTQGSSPVTGTVQFTVNGVNATSSPTPLSNGQARFMLGLAQGTPTVGAIYSGDSNHAGSSGSIVETVNVAYAVAVNPTTIDISAPGQSGSTTLMFTAQNGFSSGGTVTVTPVCPHLPSETSCDLTSFNLPTNGTAGATLTFFTTAPSAVIPAPRNRPNTFGWPTLTTTMAIIFLLWMSLLLRWSGRKQRRRDFAFTLMAFVLLAVSAGCGGGGGAGGGVQNPGTPPGQYSIPVTLTINGVTQTLPNLTLNVQ